jgi:hypothetical protein
MKPFSFWQLTLPYGTGITTMHRFADKDGNPYNITGIDKGKSWSLFMVLTVEAV